ncbi:MAG: glycosyltransferase [Chloroflexi bacterium]|nr:glycosyltransferase [Chloroflexota bacterium]
MRIAVISVHGCPCIPPGGTDAGGMNVYVDRVSTRLARTGHGVRVYSRSHPGTGNVDDQRDYDLVHMPIGRLDERKEQLPALLPKFTAAVNNDASINQTKFDIVASHYWLSGVVGCELATGWDISHVTSFHTLASIKKSVRPEENEPEIRLVSEARVARDADQIVVWTDGEAAHMMSEFGLPKEKFAVVPPGVDTNEFSASPTSSTSRSRRRILYVGRLDALKGVDLLIDAFAIIIERGFDVELQIVGGGTADEFRRVLGRISKLRLTDRVKLPGALPQSDLPAIYSNADCIVAPSFHETFGLAVLEAAACATPAVAADVDGLKSIVIDNETGYLIPNRDPVVYADKILQIIGNQDLQYTMSNAARRRSETLSWDSTVEGLLDVYNRVVETRASAAPLR